MAAWRHFCLRSRPYHRLHDRKNMFCPVLFFFATLRSNANNLVVFPAAVETLTPLGRLKGEKVARQQPWCLTLSHKGKWWEVSTASAWPGFWWGTLQSGRSARWVSPWEHRTSGLCRLSSWRCSRGTREMSRGQTWDKQWKTKGHCALAADVNKWNPSFKSSVTVLIFKGYRGECASAIHMRSMLQASRGRWGLFWVLWTLPRLPLVSKTSTISCRLVSHRIGSPNRTTAVCGGQRLTQNLVDINNSTHNWGTFDV